MDLDYKSEILEWENEPGNSNSWDANPWGVNPWDANPWDVNPKESSFKIVLDTACERLREKQIQLSLRRINEMEGRLDLLEKELVELLGKRP